MKKLFLPVLIILIVIGVSTSCKKAIENFTGFDATLSQLSFNLPPILDTFTFNGIPIPLSALPEMQIPGDFHQRFDLDSLVKANTGGSMGAADVTSIKLKNMIIVVKNATPTSNLQAFETARFEFYSNAKSTPVEVARYTFPNTYTDSVNYVPTNSPELREYLNGKELYYKIYGKMRTGTSDTMKLVLKGVVTVK